MNKVMNQTFPIATYVDQPRSVLNENKHMILEYT